MDEVSQNLLDIINSWWDSAIERFPQLIAGLLVFVFSLYLARLVSKLVKRTLTRRKIDPETLLLLSRLARWIIIALGIVLALQQAGQDVSALLTGLGILGFTIGFALQDVSKNFIAGILLLVQQPFDLGDDIQVGNYTGKVVEVDLRATEILTFDGRRVTIPNGDVFTKPIVNFSRTTRRRITLDLNVADDNDLEQVRKTAEQAIGNLPGVLPDPPPSVAFHTIGKGLVGLTIYYWYDTQATEETAATDSGITAIKSAFQSASIQIR